MLCEGAGAVASERGERSESDSTHKVAEVQCSSNTTRDPAAAQTASAGAALRVDPRLRP